MILSRTINHNPIFSTKYTYSLKIEKNASSKLSDTVILIGRNLEQSESLIWNYKKMRNDLVLKIFKGRKR